MMRNVIVGLGSNQSGAFGGPQKSLERAIMLLEQGGLQIDALSSFYRSQPVGAFYHPSFLNLIVLGATSLPPSALLTLFKTIEKCAGRRGQLFWGARPLDIDLIDYEGVILRESAGHLRGKKRIYGQQKRAPLHLPHKEMHKRPFVLKPLIEVAPGWNHPVFGLDGAHLAAVFCSPLTLKRTEKLDISLQL